ncbi:HTH-type transcriptional repressor RspR [Ascidiaceihabitans donghaensis]|uniref:HTH-type transcriptional repressor RspR n=1 Tax=Ascidiaceihabitans donghaensis TaxID=1510460 RepID=A0A2R8BPA9_9RHOB|nr:GntR family transcriptional regulator [Ascidiaceihabitans donghaensis]SPH27426.1 HTH-type transcriptional repressor RspR [Ascidiaceihabitans donghaensis]
MTKNKKIHCGEDLKARILTQDIAPGTDLDEARLAEEYGISRTPLREILHRLAGGGFVRLEENRGAKVESMDLATLRVFFQTAPLIYCAIARQAAENRTSRQIAALKDIQVAFAAATRARDVSQSALLNHQFHEQIGEMAQNPYLFAGLKRMLIDHTRLSQTFFNPQSSSDAARVDKAIAQHDAMIAAIEAGQADVAIDLTLQHWDLSRDQLEKYVRPDPLPLDVISMKDRRNAI